MGTIFLPDKVFLYDVTLRDGAQQEGMQLSIHDKLRIAGLLDELGVDFIEGGWPGANPSDTEFFARAQDELHLRNAKLVAFGSTRKAGVDVASDPQVQALIDAGTEYVCIVAKSHERHVELALRTSLDENLAMIRDTVAHLRAAGKHVFVDAEHYFDGFRLSPGYALEVVRTAAEAGAEFGILCDTNGGMLPGWIVDVVSHTAAIGVELGIHCHNDSGCAVANTLAAVEAGAVQVQGTINGYGERTGNVDLTTVIANLQLKYEIPLLAPQQLDNLTGIANAIAEIANQPIQPRQPYVGSSAFAHKAGLHASAIKVNDDLYQHIRPEVVGNDMRMLISDMAGRASIQLKGQQLGFDLSDRDVAARIVDVVKSREANGYSYEAADASFELLVRSELGELEEPFELVRWRVFSEHAPAVGEEGLNDATVKLVAKGEVVNRVGEGNGPVNALGDALLQALLPAFPQVGNFELIDYRVRLLEQGHGTDATVRVWIDTTDSEATWTTVGVGTNVVEASWEALSDAYLYGIIKDRGRVPVA